MRSALPAGLIAVVLTLNAGCGQYGTRDIGDSTLEATFRVGDETFKVRITNSKTIKTIADVSQHTSSATIPNGALRAGPGDDSYNQPWSWHLDPEDIEMAETAPETCNGKPSDIEAHVDQWLNNVGRYCPWDAELIHLQAL